MNSLVYFEKFTQIFHLSSTVAKSLFGSRLVSIGLHAKDRMRQKGNPVNWMYEGWCCLRSLSSSTKCLLYVQTFATQHENQNSRCSSLLITRSKRTDGLAKWIPLVGKKWIKTADELKNGSSKARSFKSRWECECVGFVQHLTQRLSRSTNFNQIRWMLSLETTNQHRLSCHCSNSLIAAGSMFRIDLVRTGGVRYDTTWVIQNVGRGAVLRGHLSWI